MPLCFAEKSCPRRFSCSHFALATIFLRLFFDMALSYLMVTISPPSEYHDLERSSCRFSVSAAEECCIPIGSNIRPPKMSFEWPTDVLVQRLYALGAQCDRNAHRAWQQLAFLVCKRGALSSRARRMPRPTLIRINLLDGNDDFKIPFKQATAVSVDVDWGDGCVDKLREKGEGFVTHTYTDPGAYSVRVFPIDGVGLDHLGFDADSNPVETTDWWIYLTEIVSLGRCGLRSLSYLFAHANL
jgi:hypothetical protein